MEKELSCNIVKDLLPNYIEKLTSEETNKNIDSHLKGCGDCTSVYQQMQESIPVKPVPEAAPFKNYLSKARSKYIMSGLLIISMLSIFICFLINMLIDRKPTWSLIVTGGIVFSYAVVDILLTEKRHKIFKLLVVISIFTLPLLGIIQLSINLMDEIPNINIFTLGLPITLIWIAALWISFAIIKVIKTNHWISGALICFVCAVGSYTTNIIAEGGQTLSAVFNGIGFVFVGIILLIIGMSKKKK